MKNNGLKPILGLTLALLLVITITFVLAFSKFGFTGYASSSDTGVANITYTPSASIIFSDAECDFGSGSVDDKSLYAMLWSNGTKQNTTGWQACSGNGLEIQNVGNVNVSVTLESTQDAAGFIGGNDPSFKWKVVDSTTACVGTLGLTTFTEVAGKPSACNNMKWTDSEDKLKIEFELKIPRDAVGTKSTVITAEGTAL